MTRPESTGSGRALPALCAALLVCACSSTTLGGEALRDPRVTSDGVTLAQLQPGNFPTAPAPPMGQVRDAAEGGLVESRRMADFVVMPFQVDPELTLKVRGRSGVVKNGADSRVLPYSAAAVPLENFVAGFTAAGLLHRPGAARAERDLANSVLRLATPADAAAAVAELAARTSTVQLAGFSTPSPTRLLAIPGHPDTLAYATTIGGGHWLFAYTASGPYVLVQKVSSLDAAETAVQLTAATLDQQIPLIGRFHPTPVGEVSTLPIDPDGLLARTLNPFPADPLLGTGVSLGIYGPHGFLAFAGDPADLQRLFAASGVSAAALTGTNAVHQTRDQRAATVLADALAAGTRSEGYSPSGEVPGMPQAECGSKPRPPLKSLRYHCVAAAGRYVISVNASQRGAAEQQLAAQYLMLIAP